MAKPSGRRTIGPTTGAEGVIPMKNCPAWCDLHTASETADDLHMSQWVLIDGHGEDYIEVAVEQAADAETARTSRLEFDRPHIVLMPDEPDDSYDVHLSPGRARALGNTLLRMADAAEPRQESPDHVQAL